MTMPQIDNVSAGYVFAYDAKTGDVLWTHEKIVEVIRGREDYPVRLTDADCEQVRTEAARVFRGREVKALIAPEGFTLAENVRVKVDPDKRTLHTIRDEGTTLADRFASYG
jgi:hypothetical protein